MASMRVGWRAFRPRQPLLTAAPATCRASAAAMAVRAASSTRATRSSIPPMPLSMPTSTSMSMSMSMSTLAARDSHLLSRSLTPTSGASTAPPPASSVAASPGLGSRRDPSAPTAFAASMFSGLPRRSMSSSPKKKARRARERGKGVAPSKHGHFTVALVGLPNVGKSTLFNRLAGRRLAIVNSTPGTTRDWKEAEAYLAGLNFTVVDTGGLDDRAPHHAENPTSASAYDSQMLPYTSAVLRDADVVLFIVDARRGLTPEDSHFAQWVLQQRQGPVRVVANKTEGLLEGQDAQEVWDQLCSDLYSLGMGEPTPVSAEHGDGLADLFQVLEPFALEAGVDTATPETDADGRASRERGKKKSPTDSTMLDDVCLAIVGRPNAGKSTLVNRLLDTDRVLTGPTPGVTRDSIKIRWNYDGRTIHLVDTAGIRRLGMWDPKAPLEGLAINSATKALGMAHVAALVLDCEEPFTKQDLAIAQRILDEGRGLVVLLNKVDKLENVQEFTKLCRERLESTVADARGASLLPVSALHGGGVDDIMPAVISNFEAWNRRISTGKLNRFLAALSRHHPPPAAYKTIYRRVSGGKLVPVAVPLKIKTLMQINTRPPTFALFANRTDAPVSYTRFLLNAIREEFGFDGVPMRLVVRTSKNPYAGRK